MSTIKAQRTSESSFYVPGDDEQWMNAIRRMEHMDTRPLGYSFDVFLLHDPDGGFTATLPRLPGVISEGDTKDEAIRNIKEAAVGCLQSYLDRGQPVPWLAEGREPTDDEEKVRVAVNV